MKEERDSVDVCIIGAGTSGIACAQELAHQGKSVVLLDRLHPMPPCLKAEKIDAEAVLSLLQLGFHQTVASVLTPLHDVAVFFGERRLGIVPLRPPEGAILYHEMVNSLRGELDSRVDFRAGEKVVDFEHFADGVEVVTESGTRIRCRLAIVSTGDAHQLLQKMGATYEALMPYEAFAAAFDLEGVLEDQGKPVDSQTYHHPFDGCPVAFATFFRLGEGLRANIFCPSKIDEEWQNKLRHTPMEALAAHNRVLAATARALHRTSPVMIRKVHVGRLKTLAMPRVVVLGDAAHTIDPTGGGGFVFALLEAELLAGVHAPQWLQQDECGVDTIAEFYDDRRRLEAAEHFFSKTRYLIDLNSDPSIKGKWRRLRFTLEHIRASRTGRRVGHSANAEGLDWQLPAPFLYEAYAPR